MAIGSVVLNRDMAMSVTDKLLKIEQQDSNWGFNKEEAAAANDYLKEQFGIGGKEGFTPFQIGKFADDLAGKLRKLQFPTVVEEIPERPCANGSYKGVYMYSQENKYSFELTREENGNIGISVIDDGMDIERFCSRRGPII